MQKRTQAEINLEKKNPITQLEKPKERLNSRVNKAEDRISRLKDEVEIQTEEQEI